MVILVLILFLRVYVECPGEILCNIQERFRNLQDRLCGISKRDSVESPGETP